jgi:hypothetical protein
MRRSCLILLLTMALAACKGSERPASNATAGGEILPGSVSDAMLPLDQVRSQPPLAPRETGAAARQANTDAAIDADAGPGPPPPGEADGSGGEQTTPGAE